MLFRPIWGFGLLLLCNIAFAKNPAARYEIDAKRNGVSPTDKDALPRGREFVRLDSTYYVGWLYQGLYLFDRSADEGGYRRSLPYMYKAFTLFEKDFGTSMKALFNDPVYFMQNIPKLQDYMQLAQQLKTAYENLEINDSAMWVVTKVEEKNMRRDFFGVAGSKAWITHRARFYKNSKYKFLGNSVAENEQKALAECYKGLQKIKRNEAANNQWYGEGHSMGDKANIYHYMALIHCYIKNYDSSEYYYNKMKETGTISWNNYANMKHETGFFKESIEDYTKDKYKYNSLKFMREPFYYLPTLSIYGGNTKEAMATSQEAVLESNSTPGFGWYNLALARSYLYDGQLDSADIILTKAKNFKEIHIGTTLTQQQYDFTNNLLRQMWYYKKIEQVKFFHKNWWYNPSALAELAQLKTQQYLHEYMLATQLATNPERERLMYELFCAESTVSFDEVYYLIKNFSTGFFIEKMNEFSKNDPRLNIKRYFDLMSSRLNWAEGNENKAFETSKNLLDNTVFDTANEKLFTSRMYEVLAHCYDDKKDADKSNFYVHAISNQFAQLLPFTGFKTKVKLITTGTLDIELEDVINELKNCNIEFVETADKYTLTTTINFVKKGIKYEAVVTTKNSAGKTITQFNRFLFKESKGAGQEIAMRIFGKGGAFELE